MLDKRRIGSFILGGVTGVLAGVLLAPRSGRETRGTIANRAGEARQRGRETYFDTHERLRERISATREGTFEETTLRGGSDETAPPESEVHTPEPSEKFVLRDVSRGSIPPDEESGQDRSEELRRKVRETRERLRGRKEPRGGSDE